MGLSSESAEYQYYFAADSAAISHTKSRSPGSVSDDFHEDAFATQAVEFAVKNLLPRTEVEATAGHGDNDLAAHDAALEVRVGVVLRAIVTVLAVRFFRGELFQPFFEIGVESTFVVIDEDAGRDVHGIDQTQSFFDAAGAEATVNLRRDVEQPAARGDLEPEFFAEGFQGKRIEQKVTKATKEKLPELNRFVIFV